MEKVKFKKFHPEAKLPVKATELAGCHDVYVTKIEQLEDDFVICYLGFGLTPPPNMEVVLVPRSSLTKTKWMLQNSPGQGDPDYTGEYQFRFRALPDYYSDLWEKLYYPAFPYKVGDRIGQIYLREIIPIEWEEVEELPSFDRKGGFGSTGK